MDAKEFRSGNFIIGLYQNEEDDLINETICEFKFYNCYDNFYWVESKDGVEEYIGFKPIELTEEWLQKFGFHKVNGCFNFNKINIFPCSDLEKKWFEYENDMEIKSVHQLQNVYFSLTGKELEIK
jgi:hypothetical protein